MSPEFVREASPELLAEVLPGSWNVRGSNFPTWVMQDRYAPVFRYSIVSADPLVLADDVSFLTAAGETRHILGTDRWDGDSFLWRGSGIQKVLTSRWSVDGMSDDGNLLVIRFGKSLVTEAGIDVIERQGTGEGETRSRVACASAAYGLTPEDFASLTWMGS